ncbi:MAG: NUDIX domain-containing protein [Pseudomonadota bacterium]
MDLFFYGTLCHVPLLEIVLGRPAKEISMEPAQLQDHRVAQVISQSFPMILHQTGSTAFGLLVRDLSETDYAKLRYYEGGFDYTVRDMSVATEAGASASAWVFFPSAGRWTPGEPWHLDIWAAEWGAMTELAAIEVMAHHKRLGPEDVGRNLPAMRLRAAARLAARARPADGTRSVSDDVVLHRHHRGYLNFFSFDDVDVQYRQHDGSMGPVVNRGVLLTGRAAVVLPYDPVLDTVLLVEQFRVGAYMIDDPAPWIWEAVAGMVDPGETPEQAARREAIEEAGIHLAALEPAGEAFSSTGSSTEYVHLYVGITDLSDVPETGGLAEEGEDIRSQKFSFDELMHMLDSQQLRALPLVSLANWLARHRDRLRR